MPNLAYGQEEWLIQKAANVIEIAARPVILVGLGARGQGNKLLKLASKISAPIMSTFRAKGVVDEHETMYVGCHGGIGSTAASELMQKSDLLIAVGSSFSDLSLIPQKKTVQIDINPLMIAGVTRLRSGWLETAPYLFPS